MSARTFTLNVTAPPVQQVTGLTVTGTTSSSVSLSWNSISGATLYRIYRGGSQIATSATASYTDTGLTASTPYSYTVSAVVGGIEGPQSASVNATTQGQSDTPYSPTTWGGVILTEAEHNSVIPGTNNPHFERTWFASGGWNGEGFMRWRVAYTQGEDGDGYTIQHPNTASRSIFLSFVSRLGPTWWQSHTSADRFKSVMFYNTNGTNPRPTVFNMPIFAGNGGAYAYRTWGPDLEAGGAGYDEFGTGPFDWNLNYPNHRYQEGPSGSDWWFTAVALNGDRTQVYLWNRAGTIAGLYAQSPAATGGVLTSWNASTWDYVLLLGYIEATTAGDANAYMDIGRIRVTQTLPSPPAGFVTG